MNLSGKYVKAKLTKMKNICLIKGLYAVIVISRKRLYLDSISFPDPIIISGNHFSLFWKVSGCYKILVNDTIVLPGNTTMVYLDSNQIQKVLTICFYGFGSVLKRKCPIVLIDVELKWKPDFNCQTENFIFRSSILISEEQKFFQVTYSNPEIPHIPDMSKFRPLISIAFTNKLLGSYQNIPLHPEYLTQKV